MKTFSLLTLLLFGAPLHGQLVGATETFTDQENANTWKTYDYSVGQEGQPLWKRSGSEADPEIYTEFIEDFGVSLFADENSSDGYFVGDYVTQGVAGVFCNVFIEDSTTLDSFEFYFVSEGVFFYSNYFEVDTDGWSSAENSFQNNDWYVGVDDDGDGFIDDYVYTPLTDDILSNVSEIGVNFFPISDAADGSDVAIDNFTLVADLSPVSPVLAVSADSGSYSFEGLPGVQYTVEQSATLQENGWAPVETPFEGSGPYSFDFTTASKQFLRVKTEALYTEVPKVGS
ncbi:hypothetical protein V2O64_00175 [Verrucomicrobiaceae bacterium 227]